MENVLLKKIIAYVTMFLFIGMCFVPITGSVKVEKIGSPAIFVNGTIRYVGGGGGGNYSSIQEAIDDSVNGDTVFVYDDSSPYEENIRINKQILVTGEERDTTVIKGTTGQDHVVRISSKNAEINGFTIRGATVGQDGVTVYPLMEDSSIINNIIKECSYGIFLQATSARITISNNLITNNDFSGIFFQESDRNVITGNTISNNGDYGISLKSLSKQNDIINNIIENNFAGILVAGSSSQNDITGNHILNNDMEGIFIDGLLSTSNTLTGNNITNNNGGIKITSGGKNIITSNNIQDKITEAVKELKRNGYLVRKSSKHGQAVYINPHKRKQIETELKKKYPFF